MFLFILLFLIKHYNYRPIFEPQCKNMKNHRMTSSSSIHPSTFIYINTASQYKVPQSNKNKSINDAALRNASLQIQRIFSNFRAPISISIHLLSSENIGVIQLISLLLCLFLNMRIFDYKDPQGLILNRFPRRLYLWKFLIAKSHIKRSHFKTQSM